MKADAAVWLRRDLRTEDHPCLLEATQRHDGVLLFFILDPRLLTETLPGRKPLAVFLGSLLKLKEELSRKGKELLLLEGDPAQVIPLLVRQHSIRDIYAAKEYEPGSVKRDTEVERACREQGATLHLRKDHVLLEEAELLNQSGKPYQVFSAYRNAYLKTIKHAGLSRSPFLRWSRLMDISGENAAQIPIWERVKAIHEEGLREFLTAPAPPGEKAAKGRLEYFVENGLARYETTRNLLSVPDGTSRLSADLRSGALSIRQVWRAVLEAESIPRNSRDAFLSELVWRDFFFMIGACFPRVFAGPFREKYQSIGWRNRKEEFEAWCEGRTGYPIVDAGMRELLRHGYMHNRARMITAMFLVKDLLIDWRWGEEYFRKHLIDGDQAINNGNWQWCASTGCDAQPYFRIFNPSVQGKRYDPDALYIKSHLPELRQLKNALVHAPHRISEDGDAPGYPEPITSHENTRMRCLLAYGS